MVDDYVGFGVIILKSKNRRTKRILTARFGFDWALLAVPSSTRYELVCTSKKDTPKDFFCAYNSVGYTYFIYEDFESCRRRRLTMVNTLVRNPDTPYTNQCAYTFS